MGNYDRNRKVGEESSRTYLDKIDNGFFDKYMSGKGLEIGSTGYLQGTTTILETATGIDLGYPGYDGIHLPFETESQDYVYSSHCLEHINDFKTALQEWYRVLKIGGHMTISVPHHYLYEKKPTLPSRYNGDHKRFYSPCDLLLEIEQSLIPNTYRVRLLEDGDKGYDYNIPPYLHCHGQAEITIVLQKIEKPVWDIK